MVPIEETKPTDASKLQTKGSRKVKRSKDKGNKKSKEVTEQKKEKEIEIEQHKEISIEEPAENQTSKEIEEKSPIHESNSESEPTEEEKDTHSQSSEESSERTAATRKRSDTQPARPKSNPKRRERRKKGKSIPRDAISVGKFNKPAELEQLTDSSTLFIKLEGEKTQLITLDVPKEQTLNDVLLRMLHELGEDILDAPIGNYVFCNPHKSQLSMEQSVENLQSKNLVLLQKDSLKKDKLKAKSPKFLRNLRTSAATKKPATSTSTTEEELVIQSLDAKIVSKFIRWLIQRKGL